VEHTHLVEIDPSEQFARSAPEQEEKGRTAEVGADAERVHAVGVGVLPGDEQDGLFVGADLHRPAVDLHEVKRDEGDHQQTCRREVGDSDPR
jgi:hypothetical protein